MTPQHPLPNEVKTSDKIREMGRKGAPLNIEDMVLMWVPESLHDDPQMIELGRMTMSLLHKQVSLCMDVLHYDAPRAYEDVADRYAKRGD